MLRLTDLRLPLPYGPFHTEPELCAAAAERLRVPVGDVRAVRVVRRSLDARKKGAALFLYSLDVEVGERGADEARVLAALGAAGEGGVTVAEDRPYVFPVAAQADRADGAGVSGRPVVVGAGPCGLFAALALAQAGFAPLVLERGRAIEERARAVDGFWAGGPLDPDTNVQFGEGGAGAFSDGKLTTQIKERRGRVRKVLAELVAHGAPDDILWQNRPHVGTDLLRGVVLSLRRDIERLGGEFRFGARVDGLVTREGRVAGVKMADGAEIPAGAVVLAIGHSARDTFAMLRAAGAGLEPKPFAMGCRIEHPQRAIDRAQLKGLAEHGGRRHPALGPADYKLAYACQGTGMAQGRSAYTFCMCPGGLVIAAASEEGGVVTNGMSLHARDGVNANSALLVNVLPADAARAFPQAGPLCGVEYQRLWEREAFQLGGGDYRAPAQTVGDFLQGRASRSLGLVDATYTPGVTPADLSRCLPEFVTAALREALGPQAGAFGRKLRGFDSAQAVLTGVETRSSSPVRILRGPDMQSATLPGLFPAGEGAGYAGGIVSSAVDGLRVAEAVALTLCGRPVDNLEADLETGPETGQEAGAGR